MSSAGRRGVVTFTEDIVRPLADVTGLMWREGRSRGGGGGGEEEKQRFQMYDNYRIKIFALCTIDDVVIPIASDNLII